MSYIPSVRCKEQDIYGKVSDNAYWQGYLGEEDANFVAGYDYAVAVNIDCFFDNIDFMGNVEGDNVISADDINLSLGRLLEKRPEMLDDLKQAVFQWMEAERDHLVVGMLDDTDEKEYAERKAKADSGDYANVLYQFAFEDDPERAYYEYGEDNGRED